VLTFERRGKDWKLVEVSPTEMKVDTRPSDTART
jgi:hypothetical protein